MMTLEEFRATGKDVANLDDEPHHLGVEGPGRVYLYDGGPFIERWEDDRHGIAPPNGPTWLLIIGRDEYEGELSKLEPLLFMWALGEAMVPGSELERLSAELVVWCGTQGLTPASADELLHAELTQEQRHWLSDFVQRWDEADQ